MPKKRMTPARAQRTKYADAWASRMLPMIHFAILRGLDPEVLGELMDIWVSFNTDWYRFADLPEAEIDDRLRRVLAEYCTTGFGFSPEEVAGHGAPIIIRDPESA